MKIPRLFSSVLLALIIGTAATAQESAEFASLRAKAEKGNGIAQYNLGLAYLEGRGTAADPLEAYVWLSLARENGARGRALDGLIGSPDRAAFEAAQQKLAAYKAAAGMKTPGPAVVRAEPAAPAAAETDASRLQPGAPAPAATRSAPAEDSALARLHAERDSLSTRLNELAAEVASLRADRQHLAQQAAESEKFTQAASEANRNLHEQVRSAEAHIAGLTREGAAAREELARTQQTLTALEQARKPAPDTAALDAKVRELQAALAELETSRSFGRQVEETLNKVTDQKTALEARLAALGTDLSAAVSARAEAQAQVAALAQAKAAAEAALAARPASPGYPDLSGRVAELEAQLAALTAEAGSARQQMVALTKAKEDAEAAFAAKPAAPAYPDLSGQVAELEGRITALTSEASRARQDATVLAQAKTAAEAALAARPAAPNYPDLSNRVRELEGQVAALTRTAAETQQALAAARQAAPAYPDLSGRVGELESKLAATEKALAEKPAAPAYPDLSDHVKELEQALADTNRQLIAAQNAKPVAPAYPDLSGRVAELEAANAKAREEAAQKIAAMELARAELSRQFDAYKSATVASQRESTTLQASVKMLESDKASLRRQAEAAASEAAQLRTQVAALRTAAAAVKP
ncbi:MAG: hypothetical protein HYV75_09820, partial [Opitutae bacterium]|nr:hypothetical protein [Opitutae bacterium]